MCAPVFPSPQLTGPSHLATARTALHRYLDKTSEPKAKRSVSAVTATLQGVFGGRLRHLTAITLGRLSPPEMAAVCAALPALAALHTLEIKCECCYLCFFALELSSCVKQVRATVCCMCCSLCPC